MTYLVTIIVFLVIFSFLILVHEVGHFVMAKRAGIKVEEFGLGLPPRIWGKKKGETIYSINWIPFGGFVRMYGEDGSEEKMLRSKRSFAGKPMRARVKVIIAGVVMNFLVAWMLMVVGFTAGMQPLLVPDEILDAVNRGDIIVEPGLIVKEVEEGSEAYNLGFEEGHTVYAFGGQKINDFVLQDVLDNSEGRYSVIDADGNKTKIVSEKEFSGMTFHNFSFFPRVKVYDLPVDAHAYKFGLRAGDVILTINGQQVFGIQSFEDLTRGEALLDYEVYRDGEIKDFLVVRSEVQRVIVSDVVPSSPAMESGLRSEDVIISVNGKKIVEASEFVEFVWENRGELLAFVVQRGDETLFYEMKPDEDGRVGVVLSELIGYGADKGMRLYNVGLLSSVMEIKDEKYPFHVSLYKAFGETYKLSKFTVVMFGDFVGNLVRGGGVRETVAGPVGIAQMTHMFVQEGFIPILRFVAILSLSLAVINILPIPALDGGRLLFILVELIIGRRVPQRGESFIHAFGYILILLLIFAVTYGDIMRIANS